MRPRPPPQAQRVTRRSLKRITNTIADGSLARLGQNNGRKGLLRGAQAQRMSELF